MSSSSTSPQWKHDVLVSFRKDDVINFISNLFKRLNQVGINYFEDNNKEDAGQKNEAKRLNAICQQTFAFALVVFSENYVNCSPCLNKLVEICKKDPKPVVIPIFYMDRARVSESASNALAMANKISGYCELEAANGSGERNLIDKIVGRLVNEIHSLYSGNKFIFGPFGSKGGNDWKSFDIKKIDSKGIAVVYREFIESVTFEVDGHTPTAPQNDGRSTFKVQLERGEYITSFAGSKNASNGGINSLTFRTNKRILGPIGREEEEVEEKKDKKDETDKKDKKDKKQKKKQEEEEERKKKEEKEERRKKLERKKEEEYFSVPSDAGEVIEFFWRKGDFLESVGARVQLPSKEFYPSQSVVGIFGKEMGTKWDDKPTHANVRNIIVYLDHKQKEKVGSSGEQFIRSIELTYEEKNGRLGETTRHGSNTVGDVNTITIDCRYEYLTSISGYYTEAGITSLTFRTNKQETGPIGKKKGIYFSSPAGAGKIVGFYGYIDGHLCGIGAYFEPISDLHPVKSIGPFGGGCPWDDGKFDGVREIHLFIKSGICGIKFVYDDGSAKGHTVKHGNCTKGVSDGGKLVLSNYPREYLTSISGYTQEDGSILLLVFHSNREIHGPYGKVAGKQAGNGKYFGYPSTGSRIIGFYGTSGKTLNSIGVYVEPILHLYPFKIFRPPIEGSGGTSWDDGVHTNVRGFRVTDNKCRKIIESITFKYDDNGSLVEGSRHGGGGEGDWTMLNFPEERLISITGCMLEDSILGQTIIHSLTIYTTNTMKLYGPYAYRDERDKAKSPGDFKIPKDGRIVGFFGTAKQHLNSIGARLEPY